MIVETVEAIVFKAGGRRYFTKNAAYLAAARNKIKTKCECYDGSNGYDGGNYYEEPPETCKYHEDTNRYEEIKRRLAYIYKQADFKSL